MINLAEYIKLSKEVRQKHVKLELPCLERGGNSTNHKGVLAQFLNTNIPSGRILLCHACGNGKCSEPAHLYWGTDRENIVEDGTKFGTWKSPWERQIKKHGLEYALEERSRVQRGNTSGSGNKGKPKSEEHKKKISDSIKKLNKDNHANGGGRKPLIPSVDMVNLVKEHGYKGAASLLNLPVDTLRSRYYTALTALKKKD